MASPNGEPVWLTRRTSSALGNDLILLTPFSRVFRVLAIVQSAYPWLGLALVIMVGIRTLLLDRQLVRPMRQLATMIDGWRIEEDHQNPPDLVLQTREFDMVFRRFREKADEARQSFLASEVARQEAQNAQIDLENSERALQNINEALEDRVEKRSNELRQAYTHLMESERLVALGSLVAGVAHEVNTPLGISVTTSSYLADRMRNIRTAFQSGTLSRQALESFLANSEEGFTILKSSLERAANLISSFKRIAVDQNTEIACDFNLNDLIKACLLSLQHEAKSGRHRFMVECPDNLWFKSYPGIFTQILTNLVMNSLNHGLFQRQEGIIRIEADFNDELLHILVSDNGVGMGDEIQKHLFEPFFTTSRERGGSGLGLSIVFNLVTQKLNGKIQCTSVPGNGTDFDLFVPLVPLNP
jgi:signal transduction histidine kinase